MKNKLRTTSFWLELSGVLVLFIDAISGLFNLEIYSDKVQDVILSICAVLISLGLVNKKNVSDSNVSASVDLFEEIQDDDKK